VGQAIDEARHEVELTRVALAADIDKLERRIRAELDWKARLRRDGPQIIAIAGAVVVVGVTVLVLRSRFGGRDSARPGAAEKPRTPSVEELARQVEELRAELRGKRKGKGRDADGDEPLWQKLAVRARRYSRQAQAASEHAETGH